MAAGVTLALALAAWQFFSPVSRELIAGRDVGIALLGERSSVFLIYHPFSDTVGAFTSQHAKPRRGATAAQRAGELALAAAGPAAAEKVFYVELSSAPEMDALWAVLNGWRAEPRLFLRAASWTRSLKSAGATNLSGFDLFSLFSEFLRLGSSNFILTEVQRRGPGAEAAGEAGAGAVLVEVFNASGRSGLAAATAKSLREAGFDVITEGNYATVEKHTRILGFSRDTAAALALRGALGLEELEIRVKPGHRSVAAAAVVLGEDFDLGTQNK